MGSGGSGVGLISGFSSVSGGSRRRSGIIGEREKAPFLIASPKFISPVKPSPWKVGRNPGSSVSSGKHTADVITVHNQCPFGL